MRDRRDRGDRGFDRGFGGGRGGGGFRRGGFEDDRPKPVKVGEEYDVKITDVGTKGDGITKVENFIVFVANAKKGEECRIKIKEVAQRFAIGEKIGASEDKESSEESSEETVQAEESEEEM